MRPPDALLNPVPGPADLLAGCQAGQLAVDQEGCCQDTDRESVCHVNLSVQGAASQIHMTDNLAVGVLAASGICPLLNYCDHNPAA